MFTNEMEPFLYSQKQTKQSSSRIHGNKQNRVLPGFLVSNKTELFPSLQWQTIFFPGLSVEKENRALPDLAVTNKTKLFQDTW